jgi:hypothetical protein
MSVPVRVKAQFPATVAVEQLAALAAGAKLAISTASAMTPMFVPVSLLFMRILQT